MIAHLIDSIICADDKCSATISSLLAAQSPFLRSVDSWDMILLPGVNSDSLNLLLEFLYSGRYK